MTDRDELHLLSGAYALDALSDSERAAYERYLSTSEEARAEAASLSDTAVMLGLATEAVTPPSSLRASILAQVATTPQLPALEDQPDTAAATTSNVTSIFDPHPVGTASARAKRRWYARPATFLVAAVAVIAIFAGTTVVNYVNTTTQQQQQAMSVTRISAASDSQHATSEVTGGGKLTLIWSNQLKRSAVVMTNLPALPAGKTYELWYIAGAQVTPAGMFVPASDGSVTQVLAGSMTDGDTIGITVEPAGGSKQPTTKPVVAISTV